MRRFALIATLLATSATAENWQRLNGAEIIATLTGAKVSYTSGAWQDFRASGRTLYNAGRDSWGYWAVRGDQYCSMWPPSDLWACYDVDRNDSGIRFIGEAGDTTDGNILPNG